MLTLTAPPADWTPERIRALRKRLGWTQAQLADALGYELARSVSDLESPKRQGKNPSGSVRVLLDLIEQHDGLPRKGA